MGTAKIHVINFNIFKIMKMK